MAAKTAQQSSLLLYSQRYRGSHRGLEECEVRGKVGEGVGIMSGVDS